jgi:FMN phosphatase YigB (HAD superfamily)
MPGLLSAMRRGGHVPDLPYDAIIDSSEIGHIKPEIEIFNTAMERAGVPAEETLLIDDSRPNLMAAEKLGWHVLWFDDSRPDEMSERVRQILEPAD